MNSSFLGPKELKILNISALFCLFLGLKEVNKFIELACSNGCGTLRLLTASPGTPMIYLDKINADVLVNN